MAINREGYASLIESVQEAVSSSKTSTGAVNRAVSRRAFSTRNTSGGNQIPWGDPSIGGARNGEELAQWLASQQGGEFRSGGKPNTMTIGTEDGPVAGAFQRNASSVTSRSTGSSTASSKRPTALGLPTGSGLGKTTTGSSTTASTAGRVSGKSPKSNSRKFTSTTSGKTSTSGGSSSKPSAKRPTVSVADVQEALDILEELNESKWASGAALSYQLQNMQNSGPSVSTGASKGGLRSRRNPLARTSGTSSTGSSTSTKGTAATTAGSVVSEDWDILDEILAEGIELYGEDGLAEILADFAETGEISDELALLLSDE